MNEEQRDNLLNVTRQIRDHLEIDMSQGISDLVLPQTETPTSEVKHDAPIVAAQPAASSRPVNTQKEADLATLQEETSQCNRCSLCKTRKNLVFGVGNPDAELMFIGEAPGADEDAQGIPFVGRAGKLLTRIITQGMKMERANVYIANILKCRPPANRTPSTDEMAVCMPHLMKQIEIIDPAIIVTLGATALNGLTQSKSAISKERGRFRDWNGIQLMPTFHPAYLLRNPPAKKDVWEDIKKVIEALNTPSES